MLESDNGGQMYFYFNSKKPRAELPPPQKKQLGLIDKKVDNP